MKSFIVAFIPAVLVAAILVGCAASGEKCSACATPGTTDVAVASSSTAPLSAEDSVIVEMRATVEAIDMSTREVTLKGSLGNTVTFIVDKRVQRLDEVKVGDEVVADYYVSLAGELRAPTEAEARNPITIVEGQVRAPKGTDPGAAGLRAFKVVTTVQGLDLTTQTVTLRGPGGRDVAIRAKKLENFKQLRIGDTIVVTYTEALAISLEKAPKK